MLPFRFRLQSLLRVRAAERDERRAELAEAQRAEQALRRRCKALEQEIGGLRRKRAVCRGAVEIDQLVETARYESLLAEQNKAIEKRCIQAGAHVQDCRDALLSADQQVRALEKLQETQQQRHQAETDRAERKISDEAALLRQARRAGGVSPLIPDP